jgi:hypothetical protein
MRRHLAAGLVSVLVVAAAAASCGSPSTPSGPTSDSGSAIRDDAGLFRLFTVTDPQGAYAVFPNTEPFTTGRLNGSEAHRPVIRVLLNATAAAALVDGRLAPGARFPDGSIIIKEIRSTATTPPTLYAVMVKDRANDLAGNGWLWAEYSPSGSVAYSVSSRGGACTSCHLRESGPQNDLVRTFERQR